MQQIITRGIHLIKTIYSETIKLSSLTIFIEMLCKWSANNVKSLLGNCSGGKIFTHGCMARIKPYVKCLFTSFFVDLELYLRA